MKKTLIISIFFLSITSLCRAQIDSVLVCNVRFNNSKFSNPHAGSGFLLKYKGKMYGITAKHVLFFAKTDSMKTISFGDGLKSWEFISKTNSDKKIVAGKLINENPNELIEMPPKGDWLIFEVKGSIPKGIAIYNLKEAPLEKDEGLYFHGYPYKSPEPIKIKGKFIGYTKDGNLSLDVPNGNYGGCSGGPVLDKDGKLVGIVSMGYFNQKEQKYVFEPASLDYFRSILEKYQSN